MVFPESYDVGRLTPKGLLELAKLIESADEISKEDYFALCEPSVR
jgi:hypothetical protein